MACGVSYGGWVSYGLWGKMAAVYGAMLMACGVSYGVWGKLWRVG